MRLSAVAFFMILTTVFLSGCGKDEMASLDNRGTNYYGRNGTTALNSGFMQQAVPVMSVSSNDLAAPAPVQKTAMAAPIRSGSDWQWPVRGKVTETFGQQATGTRNEGIVISADAGTPIRAANAGQVAYVGNDTKTYGNIVILRHATGEMTSYSHAQSIIVKQGDHVPSGATLGYVGQSGNAKVPELHFAVRDGKSAIDPLTKLPQQPQQMASN